MKRFLAVLALTSVIAACSSDSATEPTLGAAPKPDSSIAIFSVRYADTTQYAYGAEVSFGSALIDTTDWMYGQRPLFQIPDPQSVVVQPGVEVNLLARASSALWIFPSDKTPSFDIFSDWQPINAAAHPGIKIDSKVDMIFRIGTVLDDTTYASLGYEIVKKASPLASSYHFSLPVPVATNTLRYVFPSQRFSITCVGNDSVVFHSVNGLTPAVTDKTRIMYSDFSSKVNDIVGRCTMYPNRASADAALASMRIQASASFFKSYRVAGIRRDGAAQRFTLK